MSVIIGGDEAGFHPLRLREGRGTYVAVSRRRV